jgi:hypothetical protein
LITPFLSDLDSSVAVKGSRGALAVQPIWTCLGRRYLVDNLTTLSTSVRGFMTLLLGLSFAERVAEHTGRVLQLVTFLKWEQIAAYARGMVNQGWTFRGTDRVRKNLVSRRMLRISAPHVP